MLFLLSVSGLAIAGEACDDPFAISGDWKVADQQLTLDRGVLRTSEGVIATEVIEAPSTQGVHVVFVTRTANGLLDLWAWDAKSAEPRLLVGGETPMQATLSRDGETVAYVNGSTGLASVYTVPFAGGEPNQLTNVGLVHTPGHAPLGFVAPPSQGGLHFDGDQLFWEGPDQTHHVAWRGGAK